ncbi:synaptogyrin-2 [Rhinatrema bivittatum]|uniref:synaptogyrin-2 n=1 Tax=Rhinatrema bivittatum TaxID=194408 RepID=UPI00112630A0|nr:synaptogyrin-2 [Rhinatrema bivittatum]XP_029454983.1 synaptogyrin-2 [Rhinatrema bivittatum]
MESGAYGAAKAGGSFDLGRFLQQPQTVLRIVSAVFALIVFSCIVGEGYMNDPTTSSRKCIFNMNEDACNYGIGIGILALLGCIFFLVLDIYFPQISNATDRKYIVLADLGFSAIWAFLWFVGFCFLTNQWSSTTFSVPIGGSSAKASIAFSFFSIFTWALLACLAFKRHRMGVEDFAQSYVDPTHDATNPYSIYPNADSDSYHQQPPFTNNPESTDGYQPPAY